MADITFVSAPIGGGKSYWATRSILSELATTERQIVTNVPLWLTQRPDDCEELRVSWFWRLMAWLGFWVLPEPVEKYMTVQEWCQKYVDHPVDVAKRVRILSKKEMRRFWLYLPNGKKLDEREEKDDDGKVSLVPDLAARQGDGGCYYVLDEIHLIFSSREWTSIGNKVEHYMSQLRKLNDDVMLISQHPEKVDKNFRRNSTEWLYVQNMSKKRLFLGVSFSGRFRYQIFSSQPQRGDRPDKSGMITLKERDVHRCYDTMAGVGLTGRQNPELSKFKGRSPIWWAVFVIALALIGFFGTKYIMKFAGMATGSMVHSFTGGVVSKVGLPQVSNSPVVLNTNQFQDVPTAFRQPVLRRSHGVTSQIEPDDVTMTGWYKLGNTVYVTLSDGRQLNSADPLLTKVLPDGCVYGGQVYRRSVFVRQAPSSPAQPPAKPAVGDIPSLSSQIGISWPGGARTIQRITPSVGEIQPDLTFTQTPPEARKNF